MFTLSNSLSLCRAPLALLFLYESPLLRVCAVILAMVTDTIDGYVARRTKTVSRIGVVLDPLMDKFFVYFALTVLFLEGRLLLWEVGALASRDFALLAYGAIIWMTGRWKTIVFQAIQWGKVATALQFVVLIGLAAQFAFPWYVYAALFCAGGLSFRELMLLKDGYGNHA
jgi:phosphatidylglycerophosphate synthase